MATIPEMLINNAAGNRGGAIARATAVAAALELIAAKVANAPTNNSQLGSELENLSKYADQIQAALGQA
ncbi:hypothetical protein [Pseudomonas donghuensis]|uniref:hypothetical protein n=1 Tax=Pseudomonas donghuensis TaxID=1163398 RepID=UPI0021601F1E|nr:hypothetical protein [Pseudomonas donghuensis]UVL26810.1 hypothetical protein LOY30_12785 [Pseudomonas donghuensis]